MRLACETQSQLCRFAEVIGPAINHPAVFGPNPEETLGPIFFPPFWSSTNLGPSQPVVTPVNDRTVTAIQKYFLYPPESLSVTHTHDLWSRGRWRHAKAVSLDLTGDSPFSPSSYQFIRDGLELVNRERFISLSRDLVQRLTSVASLIRLDLRLGSWALEQFTPAHIYAIVGKHSSLAYLGLAIDIRPGEDHQSRSLPTFDFGQLAGQGHSTTALPVSTPRALTHVRLILPSATVHFNLDQVAPAFSSLISFEVIADTCGTTSSSTQVLQALCSRASQVEKVTFIVLNDVKETPRTNWLHPRRLQPTEPGGTPLPFTSSLSSLSLHSLRVFHFQGYALPARLLERLALPSCTVLVIHTQIPWDPSPVPLLLSKVSRLEFGSIGPFPDKQQAIRTFFSISDNARLILRSRVLLYGRHMRVFPIEQADVDQHTGPS
ncbi:hypothetical protein CF326_g4964 [Tilletia indica]|nr:hypothetical protein CF326_g4964 [Tilletia indica]